MRWRTAAWLAPVLLVPLLLLASPALSQDGWAGAVRVIVRGVAVLVCLAGALRILRLSRLMYRARHVRMAGLWMLFAVVTLIVVGMWAWQIA